MLTFLREAKIIEDIKKTQFIYFLLKNMQM